jgi:HlyD family secretion protein
MNMETNSMDRRIEKKKGLALVFSKKALPFWGGALLLAFILWLVFRDDAKKLRIDADNITVSTVTQGQFNDYIRISGQVAPMTTIQISPREGGVVQQIVAEEGSRVKQGDVILILSNEDLDMQILNSEANLAEKENILRNTMIQMEQQKLSIEQEKLQLQMDVSRNRRTYEAQKALFDDGLIAREDYYKAEEDYQLSANRLKLVNNRAKQDSLYRSVEINQMRESLDNMRLNMQMIRHRKDNLTIKAPIDGELGLLDVVLGQSVGAGTKIGQINNLDSYKIEAQIDEHYIDRITPGLEATFERQSERYQAQIRKVYPEVRDGKFKADFKFMEQQPDNIRSGQTYYLNLQLGQPVEAMLIPRGAFYQKTGGKWIYVLSSDGTKAMKRDIRIGRQNPQYYEVIDGLEPGEKVITSSYDNFGESDVLVF